MAGLLAATSVVVAPVAQIVQPAAVSAAGSFVDPHFADFEVWTGLDHPTTVRFASDGRAFVAEKSGVIWEYDSVDSSSRIKVLDIHDQVFNFWDRGLLSIALDPDFLDNGFIYLYYDDSENKGGTSPSSWESGYDDDCPDPTGNGCTVWSRVVRYTVDTSTNVADTGSAVNLLHDWCQQFPSHAGGALAFDSDGNLWVTGGDGASFDEPDNGQLGGSGGSPTSILNPCGDPAGEGGMLRSQDIRTNAAGTAGDPLGLDGSLIRIKPNNANAVSGNPNGTGATNYARMVATGFRNPFRMTFRPGTNDAYVADVGWDRWEEINRFNGDSMAFRNYGWPCYEGNNAGSQLQPTIDGLNWPICENMYGTGAVTAPLFAYWHPDPLDSSDRCPQGGGGSSVTGLAFYQRSKGVDKYPAKYDGALFFVDYARNCIAALLDTNADHIPDKAGLEVIGQNAEQPVDITQGPEGDLYYVDFDGKVMRLRYLTSPVARATVTPAHSEAPVDVTLDGSTSVDPNSDLGCHIVGWNWDTDNDGQFDDESGVSVSVHLSTPADYPMKLQVRSSCNDLTGTTSFTVFAQNAPPVPHIDTPPPACNDPDNGCWSVGDTLSFSGGATDPEDGNVPASKLKWELIIEHCPAGFGSACHEHFPGSVTGKATGSFTAPDHAYPSYLRIRLTATDNEGVQGSTFINLYPETSDVHVASSPSGANISIASATGPAPWTGQVITKGRTGVSAALSRTISGKRYRFSTWNDSHTRSRTITVNADKSLTATYVPDATDSCATATHSAKDTWISERSSGNNDVDWFEFHIAKKQQIAIRVANQPISLKAELYKGCSTRLVSVNAPGRNDDFISRTLAPGTYRVRVTAPGNSWSGSTYKVRFLRK